MYAVWKSAQVNLGDDFYANIVLSADQKKLSISGYNVLVKASDGSDGQIWYFKRLSDGGYNIMNCADGRMLDLRDASDSDGANVQTHPANGNAAQVWYLYDNGTGTYYIRPKCSATRVIDVNKSDGNARVWSRTYSASYEPQKFTVSKVGKPTYTVTYNANGGTGAPGNQTKTYGQTLALSKTVPTRMGYTFLGWSTSSTATSAAYQAGANYTANNGTTLYAVWEKNTSTVSGSVTSYDIGRKDVLTIRLISGNGVSEVKKVQYKASTVSSQTLYEIKDVQAGSYILEVSKEGHVTRKYEIIVEKNNLTVNMKICPKGDVTGDGKVTTMDVTKANMHAKGLKQLEGYELQCADVVGADGKVTTMDVTRINAHVHGISTLW